MPISVSGTQITFNDATTQSTAATGFASGTVLLFYQAAAPTGWTQVTTQNDKALRVVSGTGGGTGGSVAFATAFGTPAVSGSVGATTLSTSQIPSHDHTIPFGNNAGGCLVIPAVLPQSANSPAFSTGGTGGGGSHTHSLSSATTTINVQYIDIILCSAN
jgi:hypothetical protein